MKVLNIHVTNVNVRQHDRASLRLTDNLNMKVLNIHVTNVNIRQQQPDILRLTNKLNMKVFNIPVPNMNIRPIKTFHGEGGVRERKGAVILTDFRRELSVTGAKAQSACLIGRVARVGEGHRLAARRRAWVRKEDERREDASRAHWHANVIGSRVQFIH